MKTEAATRQTRLQVQKPPRLEGARRGLSLTFGRSAALLTPCLRISDPQTRGGRGFCCFKPLVGGNFLWRPQNALTGLRLSPPNAHVVLDPAACSACPPPLPPDRATGDPAPQHRGPTPPAAMASGPAGRLLPVSVGPSDAFSVLPQPLTPGSSRVPSPPTPRRK